MITKDDQPVAKLISQRRAARQPRQPGSAQGILFAQAMVEQIPVISGDVAFAAYPVTRIW